MMLSAWDPIWAKQEHVNHDCELVHILQGKVTLHLGGKKYTGKAGDTLILPINEPHRDEFPVDSVFEALLVHFTWADFDVAFTADTNLDLTALPQTDKLKLKEMVLDLYDLFKADRLLAREISDAGFYRILLFIISAIRENKGQKTKQEKDDQKGHRQRIIDLAKDYIRKNISQPITLTDIATHLGMSTFHLSHVFSQESRFTLSSYIIQMRMERAATLLQDPSKRVADVAYETGFEDPNYFGKAFRKYFNQSPGEYRTKGAGKKRK
jgi:AraC-like DNA-binding protein